MGVPKMAVPAESGGWERREDVTGGRLVLEPMGMAEDELDVEARATIGEDQGRDQRETKHFQFQERN